MNSRGQQEAPFQLLLAVAMLAMTLPLAFQLYNMYQDWQCVQTVQNNMETFARELEIASTLGGGSRVVRLDLGKAACPNMKLEKFTFKQPEAADCMRACQDPNCRILRGFFTDYTSTIEFTTTDHEEECEGKGTYDSISDKCYAFSQAADPVCVRVPFNIEFLSDDPTGYTTTCSGPSVVPELDLSPLYKPGEDSFDAGYYILFIEKSGTQVKLCELVKD